MNHSGKWTDTEFDYTSSNINRIYMYLHRECHFLLTLTCAVICGVLLVCVFALLALMWFYLFDCLFNVTSSPSVCTRSPQSPHILTTQETGKHSGKTPKLSLALVVSFVFSLHLPRSLSYDILQSVAMKRQEVRVTVVCSLLTRCLEVSSYSHCCLTFAWNAKNNTVQVWKLANNREKRTQKHPKKDISVLLSPFFLCLIFRGRLRERIVSLTAIFLRTYRRSQRWRVLQKCHFSLLAERPRAEWVWSREASLNSGWLKAFSIPPALFASIEIRRCAFRGYKHNTLAW